MAVLLVIRIAALAGASGIVFTLSLFGALVAVAWYCRTEIDRPGLAYGLPGALIVAVLAYGSRLGDAFGWLCAISSAAAWLTSRRSRRSRRSREA